jgi:methylglutaconyl-CoA hydratase
MFEALQSCPVPVIAVVHGAVFGGALGILACCDYVYAENETKYCFSEVKLGLSPAVISDFITRKIQDSFVRPLMLSAEVFSNTTALRIGLAHQSYSGLINLNDIAGAFTANGTQAMRETKKLLNALSSTEVISERKNLTTKTISERRMSIEGQARLKKFLTKK